MMNKVTHTSREVATWDRLGRPPQVRFVVPPLGGNPLNLRARFRLKAGLRTGIPDKVSGIGRQRRVAHTPERLSRATGLTLVEVLIAMFVLAIGLIGVLALLPLGQTQVKRGVVDQRATELAEEVFASIQTRKILSPSQWVASAGWNPDSSSTPSTTSIDQPFDAAFGGTRVAFVVGPNPTANRFMADPTPPLLPPWVSTLDNFYKDCLIEFVQGDLTGERRRVAIFIGSTQEFRFNASKGPQYEPFSAAPAQGDVFIVTRNQAFAIDPYYIAVHSSPGASGYWDFARGVPRVTLAVRRVTGGNVTVEKMNYDMADVLFVSDDDLKFDKPDDAHAPARQLYVMDNNGAGPLRRQSNGNFSWLATVVPAEGDIDTRNHTVSVAVFYQRPVALGPRAQANVELRFSPGPNYGGGMAKLFTTDPDVVFEDVDGDGRFTRGVDKNNIKPQQWIFVTASAAPIRIARWYRIAGVGEPFFKTISGTPTYRVDVRLAGADWDANILKRPAFGTIHEGVVGVFERSMTIEPSTVGSAQP